MSGSASSAAPSAAPSSAPTDISVPFEYITPSDKTGLITITTALACSFVVLSFLLRIYIRRTVGPWGKDDAVLAAASVLSCVQSSVVFYQATKGFGKSEELLEPDDRWPMEKAAYASDILYLVTLFLSKCSQSFLFMRLTPGRGHSRAAWSAIAASALWAIVSILLVFIHCDPTSPGIEWCTDFFLRWQIIGGLDIVTEIGLFAMSIYLVMGLQMSRSSKLIVVSIFATRLLVVGIAALRIHFLNLEILSDDPTLLGASVVVCTQFEIGYGIMTNTIPCLKPFMAVYEDPDIYHKGCGSGRGASDRAGSDFKLSPYNSASNMPTRRSSRVDQRKLRPDQTNYSTTISHQDQKSDHVSVETNDSSQMIIKKAMAWSVDNTPRVINNNGIQVYGHEKGRNGLDDLD